MRSTNTSTTWGNSARTSRGFRGPAGGKEGIRFIKFCRLDVNDPPIAIGGIQGGASPHRPELQVASAVQSALNRSRSPDRRLPGYRSSFWNEEFQSALRRGPFPGSAGILPAITSIPPERRSSQSSHRRLVLGRGYRGKGAAPGARKMRALPGPIRFKARDPSDAIAMELEEHVIPPGSPTATACRSIRGNPSRSV